MPRRHLWRARSPCGTATAPAQAPSRTPSTPSWTSVKAANPGLTVNVAPQPFGNIFDNWKLEVASGGTSPDLMIVPNDNLGQQTRDELIAPIDAKYTFPDTLPPGPRWIDPRSTAP